ncbi:alpha/beta fold hydrolase [Dactylosporangium vinaceum]|uniref:Alpha/beta hydrolase n=1 Tax=Dactylosporangium vinaceum TaxID=53362 RepID=A0ABV5M840_9ACTN|nr:alpha/beta hydrolase [Dactylosporangium vinaceum]UAB94278.1 alpha/beta fold hydrolase [Dactylosporangium vinaceum]
MRTLLLLPVIAAALTVFGPTHAPATPAPLPLQNVRLPDGRALEIVGDLPAARTVVVLIPGVDTTAANFDRGLGGVQRRAPAWQARQLAAAIDDPAVAVVAWLGYHPPHGVGLDAAREDLAGAGAAALREFVSRLPGRRIVVVGHSYGSTVAGLAAHTLDPRVTDIVALGSPGLGVDRAADLHTQAHIWAGTAPNDWTRRIPALHLLGAGHGTHVYTPSFGATAIPVGGVDGHDGYFTPTSEALRAIAALVRGTAATASRL